MAPGLSFGAVGDDVDALLEVLPAACAPDDVLDHLVPGAASAASSGAAVGQRECSVPLASAGERILRLSAGATFCAAALVAFVGDDAHFSHGILVEVAADGWTGG